MYPLANYEGLLERQAEIDLDLPWFKPMYAAFVMLSVDLSVLLRGESHRQV